MLTQREIKEIQTFYSSEEELSLLEAAMYFQKMLIFKHQLENTTLRLNTGTETCYIVTAKECRTFPAKGNQESISETYEQGKIMCRQFDVFIHMIIYQDCINLQISYERELFADMQDMLVRKANLLMNRTNYLKDIKFTGDESSITVYFWLSKGRNYYSKTTESTIKELVWLFHELNTYVEGQAARYSDWRGRTVAVDAE